jgi:transcriptional regulator with XRE-family HTH domain
MVRIWGTLQIEGGFERDRLRCLEPPLGPSGSFVGSAVKISAAQVRAARELLGWSQSDLAQAAQVGRATIADFEAGKRVPYLRTLDELGAALESGGIEFTNGDRPGVRLKPVGVLHQLADEANLDAVLKRKEGP